MSISILIGVQIAGNHGEYAIVMISWKNLSTKLTGKLCATVAGLPMMFVVFAGSHCVLCASRQGRDFAIKSMRKSKLMTMPDPSWEKRKAMTWDETREPKNINDFDLVRALKEPTDIVRLGEELNKIVFDQGVSAERKRVLDAFMSFWAKWESYARVYPEYHRDLVALRAAIEGGEDPQP